MFDAARFCLRHALLFSPITMFLAFADDFIRYHLAPRRRHFLRRYIDMPLCCLISIYIFFQPFTPCFLAEMADYTRDYAATPPLRRR